MASMPIALASDGSICKIMQATAKAPIASHAGIPGIQTTRLPRIITQPKTAMIPKTLIPGRRLTSSAAASCITKDTAVEMPSRILIWLSKKPKS